MGVAVSYSGRRRGRCSLEARVGQVAARRAGGGSSAIRVAHARCRDAALDGLVHRAQQRECPSEGVSYDITFRSVYSLIVFGFLGLVAFVTGGVIALAPSLHGGGLMVIAVVLPVVGAVVMVRCLRVRLIVDRDEIVLRNVFSTRRVPAPEIREIGWKNYWMTSQYSATPIPTLGVRRSDGKTLISTAVMGCGERQIDELLDAVHRFAARHAVVVSLEARDIYLWTWSWRKVKRSRELP
jgi:hypothetical protein